MAVLNNNESTYTVVFCFGEGGHCAQANRLADLLCPLLVGTRIVSLSDVKDRPLWSSQHYEVGELRSKYGFLDTIIQRGLFRSIKKIIKLAKDENISALISTGPGMCIVAGIILKIKGVKIIHIETWSRFKTTSLSGRLMYYLADKFYVQNESLLVKFPKGEYSGML